MLVKTPRILIIDKMHDSLPDLMRARNLSFAYHPEITPEQVYAELQKPYEGLVVRSKIRVTEELLDKSAGTLRFVGRAGAGVDNIDLPALQQRGIHLIHTPEGNRDAVAEHALGMLLNLLNHMRRADAEVRAGIWRREANRGLEIKGKTVGIIGLGNTGQAFARRLQGFDCELIAFDRSLAASPLPFVRLSSRAELLERADIISLHIPLDTENYHWVNASFFEQCRKPVFLINAARGAVLDLHALCQALESGKVRGACLDVLENEKLHTLNQDEKRWFTYLRNSDRVLLTPHVAGWTQESYRRINEVMVDKIMAWYHTAPETVPS